MDDKREAGVGSSGGVVDVVDGLRATWGRAITLYNMQGALEIEKLRKEKAVLLAMAHFGALMLAEQREHLADLDGGWVQDQAQGLGLLTSFIAKESCGEDCRCEGFEDGPVECLRYSDAALKALEVLTLEVIKEQK